MGKGLRLSAKVEVDAARTGTLTLAQVRRKLREKRRAFQSERVFLRVKWYRAGGG